MTTQSKPTDIKNPELWHFPMDYPISIIGHEGEHDSLHHEIILILAEHFPAFDTATLRVNRSKSGRFSAIKANLYVTSAKQINELYKALANAKTIRTVL